MARRDADNPAEVPSEVALVVEARFGGHQRRRDAAPQHRPRLLDSELDLKGVWRYSESPLKRAQQLEASDPRGRSQLVQAHHLAG